MYGIFSKRLNDFITAGSYEYCFKTKDGHIRLEYKEIESCKHAIKQFKKIYKSWFIKGYELEPRLLP